MQSADEAERERERDRETERDRERQRERERQTDRQRQTERQSERLCCLTSTEASRPTRDGVKQCGRDVACNGSVYIALQ